MTENIVQSIQAKDYIRPKILPGNTYKEKVGCGNIYVTVNKDDNKIIEVFAILGKSGQCSRAQTEAVTRVVSAGLQSNTPIKKLIKTLKGIRCDTQIVNQDHYLSCTDCIARILEMEENIGQTK